MLQEPEGFLWWHYERMPVAFNHTIVHSKDKVESAKFFSEIMGLPEPTGWGPFMIVPLAHNASIDFIDHGDGDIPFQHYAFLVTENEFDEIFGRIKERGLDYYADPHMHEPQQINHHDGGRGVYWADPTGHWLEIITVPYGGWPAES